MRPPSWTARADEALTVAARAVHLLAAATPVNAQSERRRLVDAATHDGALVPAWSYVPRRATDARTRLETLMGALEPLREDPLAAIYFGRAAELALEAELVEQVGSEKFAKLAARRFSAFSRSTAAAARALAKKWAHEEVATSDRSDDAWIASDSDHPDSLFSEMKREVGRRTLPFRVLVHPPLSSLAATGDGIILIASGRRISHAATRRTVLHEIDGHALPRAQASRQELAIFRIGTARGVDDQEGLALAIEARAGFLIGERRQDLAARAHAVEAMQGGGEFADVVRMLMSDYACSAANAVAVAERVFRGSDGTRPGLGRESIYMESFIRVRDHLKENPESERTLASGQVSVDAIASISPYFVFDECQR